MWPAWYGTGEKIKDGLTLRLIEREGPTGLIVMTTTLRLHPENETRMLSLTTTDTTALFAAVTLSVAVIVLGQQAVALGFTHAQDLMLPHNEVGRIEGPRAQVIDKPDSSEGSL